MMERRRPVTSRRGFTVIELVMVLVLVTILAAVAAPMIFGGKGTLTVPAVAAKIADDLRYAQGLAMRRSNLETPATNNRLFRYRVRFNVADASCSGADQYTIVNDEDGNGTWGENPNGSGNVESARMPSDGSEYFCVRLNTGDYAGITASADFGGATPGILAFDPLGTPYDSDGTRLAAAKTITVTDGTTSATITVTPNTGKVTVQ